MNIKEDMMTAKYICLIAKNIIPPKEAMAKNINKAQRKYITMHRIVNSILNSVRPASPIIEIKILKIFTTSGC